MKDKKTILVVDNERPMLELARMILERAGYSVIDAINGEDGLQKAIEYKPDLILVDFMMPVLNGIDTFERLVQNPGYREIRDTPVIMLTARSVDEVHRKELLAMGLAAYLVKPFGHRELVNVIDHVFLTHELKMENLRLQQELQASFHETIHLLSSLLAIRDPTTPLHWLMVLSLAEQVCSKLKISSEDVFNIKLAVLLHGIGKIEIAEELLSKPEQLSPDEYVRMHQHVHYGYRALGGIKGLSSARELMFHHHENYDGTGCPRGLKGEDIPIGARIVAVVDAYDAMTSDQRYRKNLGTEEALGRLRDAKSRQFDPLVVDALIECVRQSNSSFAVAKTDQIALARTDQT
jgi:putative two-component system response regulator